MARKSFFDFFPPPNFLQMPTVGISISEDAVRFVHFKGGAKGGHELVLADFGEEKLPAGSIVDGGPAKPEAIISALRKLKQDHKISFANVALPDDKAYVFKSVISVPKGASISDSVAFILEENIPIAPAETVFDFSVVSEDKVAASDEVVVTAFPEEAVNSYLEICKSAGIKALSFQIESEAAKKAVISVGDQMARLVVNFTSGKVVLAVVSQSLVQFVSVVNLFGDASDIDTLQSEVKKVCSYWNSGSISKIKTSNKIKSIIVSGNIDPKLDIAPSLSKQTGVPVTLANVWQNAFSLDETIPPVSFEDSLRFASAIGSAL
jgi:Tfp pilus assembly PilM family ATPase